VIVDAERLDRARAALKIMAERFPRAFTDPPRPLKVGVTKDLIPAVRGAVGARAVRDAIALYCRRPAYLKMQIEGATRVDLDGNNCGNVTADQAEGAKQRLEWKAARSWERALEKEKARRVEREAKAAARSKKPAARRKVETQHVDETVAVEVPEAKPKRAVVVERKPKRGAIRSWREAK
jgi:ProP effector